ncbi:LEAF RUST 10 DISEASE-RESISTANCE LOCUS RECEPTOR-LIKE PROTEIN KINASE-like 2.4 [Bienertia sinuspersici]
MMDIFVSSSCIIFILALSTTFPTSLCRLSKEYKICSQPFKCGNITDLSYPFYGLDRPSYCGHPAFALSGCDQTSTPITMTMKSQTFQVLNINSRNSTITVARNDFKQKSGCPDESLKNITIDFSIFQYTSQDANLTLFYGNCSSLCNSTTFKEFSCPMNPTNIPVCWLTKNAMLKNNISQFSCPNHLFLPILASNNSALDDAGAYNPTVAWNGFELKWSVNRDSCGACLRSGGQCGHDPRSSPYGAALTKSKIALIVFCVRKRCLSKEEEIQRKRKHDVEAFLKIHGTIGLQRYTYSDLKKLTNSFRNKLGEGGYGAVYKGQIQNTGHLVAVKILKKAEKNAEDFINEVASIGKTNHVNVVTLLGFCYEGRHRALVYDFMPNGSLEKYLYGKNNNCHSLSWEELFQIAVGIARGLEYLHRGCNTRILHFDIKPHNILLDENFCPKISDFGLAKLCPQKESLVSLSEARGTVGYIAPEVFIRSFGGVSLKSDVYSYGMLVLEMVGCRRQAHTGGDESSSEQYFPQWIYEQLEVGEALDERDMLSGEETEIQKKMILVSLWCVKTNPSSRPEMSKVVEMLEGNVESLQAPRISSLAPSSTLGGSSSSLSRTSLHSFGVTPTL